MKRSLQLVQENLKKEQIKLRSINNELYSIMTKKQKVFILKSLILLGISKAGFRFIRRDRILEHAHANSKNREETARKAKT